MIRLPRRVRGLLNTGLTWAGAWALIGAALGASDAASLGLLSRAGAAFAVRAVLEPAVVCAVAGGVSGLLFAGVLLFAERRRGRVEELRLGRVAAWGAIGAMILPIGFTVLASATLLSAKAAAMTGLFALLGGGSAATTLLAARRGARAEPSPGRLGARPGGR
ncbi:MAG TPA: hypothetical protein VF613_03100 [Longimicrobium sp.]|jgi:hypothetical protein